MIERSPTINEIATVIVDSAFRVHSQLGPGLLESVYETCLEYELKERGLLVERQRPHPVIYDGLVMEDGFRFDLLVERKVVVEIKSVDELAPVFFKQVLTYLRLADLRLGLLINFNVLFIKNGIKRVINGQVD